jgi:putative hemolysin
MITKVLFLMILIAINAFFAASEIALITLNDNKIRIMAELGNKKASQLLSLIKEPSRFLATIQIGITLAGFLASAFAAESFADPIVQSIGNYGFPISDSMLRVITVVIITIILAYFTLVLGELVPKRVAMKKHEKIAFSVVGPLTFLSKLTKPFVRLLTISTNFFVRLLGMDPNALEQEVTEEEIRMLIDVGEEKGTIQRHEKIMINNIFEFNNKTVEDVMTHRMEIFAIPESIDLLSLVDFIEKKKYSRIPVYKESLDHIVGILHVKDLIKPLSKNEMDFHLSDYMRKPLFVPLQKKTDEIFAEMQSSKSHIAIIIDEYGGTAGMVTVEDLLEEIVGYIFDEHDQDEDVELRKIAENTYEASGMISLLELQEPLDVNLPIDEYGTLNGFLISLLGGLPSYNEPCEVSYENIVFDVLECTETRIEKVKITVKVE